MPYKYTGSRGMPRSRAFLLFLIGQGVSCLGDAFQFIAATELLVKLTGSGLSAAFGMVCAPVPSLLLSPFAGSLGDKLREKHILVIIDLLRAVVVLLFIADHNVLVVYALMLLLSSLDILYSPSRKKLLVNILKDEEIMMGNSMLSGVAGVAFLIGPVGAGIAISHWGCGIAFFINSLTFVFSAIVIFFIKSKTYSCSTGYSRGWHSIGIRSLIEDIKQGFNYYRSAYLIRQIIIICTVVSFGSAGINIAFYSLAFDSLRVTSKGWGFMMSIFYGTNLLAMFITMLLQKKMNESPKLFIFLPLICVAGAWFFYGVVEDLGSVLLLQFIEGTAIAICGIVLSTQLQIVTRKSFIARIMGISDVLNSVGKLMGIGCTYAILMFFPFRFVFAVSSLILLVFTVYALIAGQVSRGGHSMDG